MQGDAQSRQSCMTRYPQSNPCLALPCSLPSLAKCADADTDQRETGQNLRWLMDMHTLAHLAHLVHPSKSVPSPGHPGHPGAHQPISPCVCPYLYRTTGLWSPATTLMQAHPHAPQAPQPTFQSLGEGGGSCVYWLDGADCCPSAPIVAVSAHHTAHLPITAPS